MRYLGPVIGFTAVFAGAPALADSVPGTGFDQITVGASEPISAFVSGPEGAPLILVLQGSGCGSVFMTNGAVYQPVAMQNVVAAMAGSNARVALVEKAHVSLGDAGQAGGAGSTCSTEFAREHSLDQWTARLSRALDGLAQGKPVSLIGMSEGAVVAARLAAMRDDVREVAFISADGCNLIDDMLATAANKALSDASEQADRQELLTRATASAQADLARIFDEKTPAETPFWGQHAGYWRTFGMACAAEDLAKSDADLLLAYGTADTNIVPAGVEAIVARRIAAGKPVETIRIADGDHALNAPGDERPFDNLVNVLKRAVERAISPSNTS